MPWKQDAIQQAQDEAAKLRYIARWLPGALAPIDAVINAFVEQAQEHEREEHQARLTGGRTRER